MHPLMQAPPSTWYSQRFARSKLYVGARGEESSNIYRGSGYVLVWVGCVGGKAMGSSRIGNLTEQLMTERFVAKEVTGIHLKAYYEGKELPSMLENMANQEWKVN